MKEKIEKYILGNYSNEELEDAIFILNDRSVEQELEGLMKVFWRRCSNDSTGDSKKFDQILNQIHHKINLEREESSLFHKIYISFSRVAAIVIVSLLIALVYFTNQPNKNNYVAQITTTVPLGAISQLELPDGTKVWLNSGSTFTYPLSFQKNDRRLVHLDGEAYFDVKKNLNLPFIIDMADMDVKVTGTAFNIRSYSDEKQLVVTLVEGSVKLGELNESTECFLNIDSLIPREVAVLNKVKNQINITKVTDLDKYISWKEGRTVFDNDPIANVVDRFEKLYNVDVLVESDDLKKYRFTLTFINETLERALRILQLSSPITYEIIESKDGAFGKRTIILKKANKTKSKV